MAYRFTDLIRREYLAEVAHRHVAAISQYQRIQASPGFHTAANYVASQLEAAGAEVVIREAGRCRGSSRPWTACSRKRRRMIGSVRFAG